MWDLIVSVPDHFLSFYFKTQGTLSCTTLILHDPIKPFPISPSYLLYHSPLLYHTPTYLLKLGRNDPGPKRLTPKLGRNDLDSPSNIGVLAVVPIRFPFCESFTCHFLLLVHYFSLEFQPIRIWRERTNERIVSGAFRTKFCETKVPTKTSSFKLSPYASRIW